MNKIAKSLLLPGLFAAAAVASAGPVALSGFSGSESVINFAALGGAPATGSFTLGVATFTESSTGTGGPGWRYFNTGVSGNTSPMLGDSAGISNIAIDFATSYDRVGFYVAVGTATYTVDFYDGVSLLGSSIVNVSGLTSQFVGWESLSGGVSRAVIRETSGENGLIGGLWNVRYEDVAGGTVPEPATMGLALLALAGVAAARRRRA